MKSSELNKIKRKEMKDKGYIEVRGWFKSEDVPTVESLKQQSRHDRRKKSPRVGG